MSKTKLSDEVKSGNPAVRSDPDRERALEEALFRRKQVEDALNALKAHDSCQSDDQVQIAKAALTRPFEP